jgi:hypothetical protein
MMNKKSVAGIIFMIALFVGAFISINNFFSQPIFSDASNSASVTSIVSSCAYDFWTGKTNVYLNNGLHLHYSGNLNLLIGETYEIRYRTDSYRMLAWILQAAN